MYVGLDIQICGICEMTVQQHDGTSLHSSMINGDDSGLQDKAGQDRQGPTMVAQGPAGDHRQPSTINNYIKLHVC